MNLLGSLLPEMNFLGSRLPEMNLLGSLLPEMNLLGSLLPDIGEVVLLFDILVLTDRQLRLTELEDTVQYSLTDLQHLKRRLLLKKDDIFRLIKDVI